MISGGSNLPPLTWRPAWRNLKRGFAEFLTPAGTSEIARWEFIHIPLAGLPFAYCKCQLFALGLEVTGFGEGFTMKSAIIKAFCEAWERLWMKMLQTCDNNDSNRRVTSSNGFAAGSDPSSAILHSKQELVERAILLSSWTDQTGWADHKLLGIGAHALKYLFERRGWAVKTYRIKENKLGDILVAIATHPEYGTACDSVYCGQTVGQEASKLLRSLGKTIVCLETLPLEPAYFLPDVADPVDHLKYYRNPKRQKAFDFLSKQDRSIESVSLPHHDQVESILHFGGSAYFPAVASSYNPHWREFTWGSLSIAGSNPFPHPLA